MHNQKIKDVARACIDYMSVGKRTTFVNLEQIMRDKGLIVEDGTGKGYSYSNESHKSLIMWVFCSQDATKVFQEIYLLLQAENKKVFFRSCPPITYLNDGLALVYPIATEFKEYDTAHWLPVTMYVGEDRNGN